MKYLSVLFILFYYFPIVGQNLVLNPSFEEYLSLPLNNFVDPLVYDFYCKYWYSSDCTSPDYYNSDNENKYFSVPENLFGYHPAKSGNGYVGICLFYWAGSMEHISGELIKPLIKDKKYRVSFYIRYVGASSYFISKDIGAYLSIKKYPFNDLLTRWYPLVFDENHIAQIKNNNGFLKNDTLWKLISGVYVAKGGEKYITIGMFYQEGLNKRINKFIHNHLDNHYNFSEKERKFFKKNQDILLINPNYYVSNEYLMKIQQIVMSYYFIDEVSVIPIDYEGNEIVLYPELLENETKTKDNEIINIDSLEVGESITLKNTFFQKGKSELLPASFLNKLVDIMQANEKIEIEISGHIYYNPCIDRYYNELPKMRAKAVVDYLISNGIDTERIIYKIYRISNSIESNNKTEEGREENKRVEITILKK